MSSLPDSAGAVACRRGGPLPGPGAAACRAARFLAPALLLGALAQGAAAAPLDALLSTEPSHTPELGSAGVELDLGYEVANDAVDFLKLRPKGSSAGDYHGRFLRAGWAATPRLWIDASLDKRTLGFKSFDADATTWQLGAQYLVFGEDSRRPDAARGPQLALRLNAWGDAAPAFERSLNAKVNGTTFRSFRADKPRDRQIQLDAIAGVPVGARLHFNAFAGLGYSRVTVGKVTATTYRNGCTYDVEFTDTHVIAICDNGEKYMRLSTPNEEYGVDVNKEARYHALTYQAGLNARWRSESWQLRAGLLYLAHRRSDVDDIVASRGDKPVKTNQMLVAEVGYRPTQHSLVYLRGQLMTHHYVGELPMTYNSISAAQHDKRYGFVTLGTSIAF